MNPPQLVIIQCGDRKQARPAPAAQLYTGTYFAACQRAARALRPTHGYLILSALHGLVRPARMLSPYDLRMGQAGSVASHQLNAQAAALGLKDVADVVVLAGRRYASACRTVWPHALTPLAALPRDKNRMGFQMQYLAQVTRLGHLI